MKSDLIHPTAIVEEGAQLGKEVQVGAYAFIGSEVALGDRCVVMHHASINGKTKCGSENEFHPFCSIGGKTQDLKYQGEPTHLNIGSKNVFREFVTINRATAPKTATQIGDQNLFLAYAHVAHDCVIGNNVIFSNNGTVAGHVIVDDHVVMGGLSAAHQFCRIGAFSMIGGCSKVVKDVPPYALVDGNPAVLCGINQVGLERHGISDEIIKQIRFAYRILMDSSLNTTQAIERISEISPLVPEVKNLLQFIQESKRGVIR
ncbi:MAG: acyl-ACP--UDP-N-acetylglucosamine O-acyltransferase [Verrucomicrobiota bacterium]